MSLGNDAVQISLATLSSLQDDELFERTERLINELWHRWNQYLGSPGFQEAIHAEGAIPSQASSHVNKNTKYPKRRIKPTLMAHIGMPVRPSDRRDSRKWDEKIKCIEAKDLRLVRPLGSNCEPVDVINPSSPARGDERPARNSPESLGIGIDRINRISIPPSFWRAGNGESIGVVHARLSGRMQTILRGALCAHQIVSVYHKHTASIQKFVAEALLERLTVLDVMCIIAKFVLSGLSLIGRLFPTSLQLLPRNSAFKILCPEISVGCAELSRNSRPSWNSLRIDSNESVSADSPHCQLVPIAYEDRRGILKPETRVLIWFVDSRNFVTSGEQQHLYSNKQRIRDRFFETLRFATGYFDRSSADFRRTYTAKAREIMSRLRVENVEWFAELLLAEYTQATQQQLLGPSGSTTHNANRIEKLEQRFTRLSTKSATIEDIEAIFFMLVQCADSHRLILSLRKHLKRLIQEQDEKAQTFRYQFDEVIGQLLALARFLAFLNYHIDSNEEHIDHFIDKLVSDAAKTRCLLLRLLWIGEYVRFSGSEHYSKFASLSTVFQESMSAATNGPIRRSQFLISAMVKALAKVLPDHEAAKECTTVQPARFDSFDMPVDEDDTVFCDALARRYISSVRELLDLLHDASKPFLLPTALQSMSAPKVQRKLRQWFWWQYPQLKELTSIMIRHIVEDISLPQKHSADCPTSERELSTSTQLDKCRRILGQSLPPIVPSCISKESEVIKIAIALALEQAQELLDTLQQPSWTQNTEQPAGKILGNLPSL